MDNTNITHFIEKSKLFNKKMLEDGEKAIRNANNNTINENTPEYPVQEESKEEPVTTGEHIPNTDPGNKATTQNQNSESPSDSFRENLLQHVIEVCHQEESSECDKEASNTDLYIIKPANNWLEQAKNKPILKRLFDDFWFEGEICILFADTNLGKSILAVHIGEYISRGRFIDGFKNETERQLVLYFDFELSDRQFHHRYSENHENLYEFDCNFLRAELNPDAEMPKTYKEFDLLLLTQLEQSIIDTNARVLIIDNITYLKEDLEKSREAAPLMKHLKMLKAKYGVSILVLAHTPKRDMSKLLTKNDLGGSKMLINFCDSAFAIGQSNKDENIRYLKQIKQRNCEQKYGADNICICQIDKPCNFVMFDFLGFGSEKEHLREQTTTDRAGLIQKITELNKEGKTTRQIGKEVGYSHAHVARLLKITRN